MMAERKGESEPICGRHERPWSAVSGAFKRGVILSGMRL